MGEGGFYLVQCEQHWMAEQKTGSGRRCKYKDCGGARRGHKQRWEQKKK